MIRFRCRTLLIPAAFFACQPAEEGSEAPMREGAAEMAEMAEPGVPSAEEDPVANARSAAPASVSAGATVVDMQGNVLAEGSGPYTCMPDDPQAPNNSPMCLDEPWLAFIQAWLNREPPNLSRVGVGYMLQGDFPVSNTDPFAEGPTPDNQWIENAGPHIMVAVPNPASLEGITTDPTTGGPWVMWKGTPYAHVMVPVNTE